MENQVSLVRQALSLQRSNFREEGDVYVAHVLTAVSSLHTWLPQTVVQSVHCTSAPSCGVRGVSVGPDIQHTVYLPVAFMPLGWLLEGRHKSTV